MFLATWRGCWREARHRGHLRITGEDRRCRGPGPGTGFSGGGRLAWSEEPEALNWLGRRGNASASCRSGCAAYAGSAGLPRVAARAAHGRFAPRTAVTRCCGRALQMAALSLVPMMCRRDGIAATAALRRPVAARWLDNRLWNSRVTIT